MSPPRPPSEEGLTNPRPDRGSGSRDVVLCGTSSGWKAEDLFADQVEFTGRTEIELLELVQQRLAVTRELVGRALELLEGIDPEALRTEDAVALAGAVDHLVPVTGRACIACGCTDAFGCEDGCSWAGPDICSLCVVAGDEVVVLEPGLRLVAGGSDDGR